MTRRFEIARNVVAAALLLVCGGTMQPAAAQTSVEEGLSDEKVMELARGYAEMLYAGEYERVWEHVSAEAKQRFGSLERFVSASESVMGRLGQEIAIVQERVEPARVGMIAHKLYHRVSNYTGVDGGTARLTIGLKNDGTIGGLTARPGQ